MSNDLISRNEVLKMLKVCLLGGDSEYEYVKIHIDDIPTAYDMDKVLKQIEADEKHTFDGCINKRYTIEIVKAGGID